LGDGSLAEYSPLGIRSRDACWVIWARPEGQRDSEEVLRAGGEEEGVPGGERNRSSTVGALTRRRKLVERVTRMVGAPKTRCRKTLWRRACTVRWFVGLSVEARGLDRIGWGALGGITAGPPSAWNKAGWDTERAAGECGGHCGLLKINQPTNGTTNVTSNKVHTAYIDRPVG
jgi:hypothetical protein